MKEKNLEECVKKVKMKTAKNGDEWMIVTDECNNCDYCGTIRIHYCRNEKIYTKYYDDERQLKLPFG